MKQKGKERIKRILAAFLSFAMIMTLVPTDVVKAATAVARIGDKEYTSVKDAWDAVKSSGKSVTIDILTDWNTESYGALKVNQNQKVTVNLHGYSINRHLASTNSKNSKKNGEVFFVDQNATLVINGSSNTSEAETVHGGYIDQQDKVWYEAAGKTGRQITGGVIVGGYSTNGAGGIHMKSNSTVNLNDVTVAGNKADDDYGGGVRIKGKYGNLNLNNSKIIYNYAEGYAGGVYTDDEYCNIKLENGSEISNNISDTNDGGGIYINQNYCNITLGKNCKIDNNISGDHGGGVYVNDDNITIKMDKTASISGNTAKNNGGGIYFNYSKIILKGGTIANNTANGTGGGGIWLEWNSNHWSKDSVTIANITFNGNEAPNGYGGAIYSEQEYVAISGCTITKNNAGKQGGALYVYNDDDSISDSTITDNTAGNAGGGVFVNSLDDLGLGGKVIVQNNTVNGKANNVYLEGTASSIAYLVSGPSSGSKVGITRGGDTTVVSKSEGHYVANLFFSDQADYHLEWSKARWLFMKEGAATEVSYQQEDGKAETLDNGTIKGTFSYPSMENGAVDLSGEFYYSDSYFKAEPTTYNNSLATMSMCLAMSAFNSSVGNNGEDIDYTLKSQNVVKLLTDIGVKQDDIYLSDYYTVKPETDSISVAIAKKSLNDTDGSILVPIAVRGSGYESEWTSNVTIGNTNNGEHEGFADAADKVFAQVQQYIKDYDLTDKVAEEKVKFWVTGYSRAGATANLTAKRLVDEYYNTKNKVFAYCMEAPQGGSAKAEKQGVNYNCIWSCINKNDPVPLVAPSNSGYEFKRYGQDYVFNNGNANDISTDSMKTQLAAVAPEINYDDYFHIATLKLFGGTLNWYFGGRGTMLKEASSVTDNAPKNTGEYTQKLLDKFIEWTKLNNTSAFLEKSSKNLQKDSSLPETSFQDALRIAVPIFFGKSSSEVDEIKEILLKKFNSEISMNDLYFDVLRGGWSTKLSDTTKKEWIWDKLWNVLIESPDGDGVSSKLSEQELYDLKCAWPTLVDTLLNFADGDYNWWKKDDVWVKDSRSESGLIVIATLLYNSSSLLQAHYPEINYAWLRAADSNYESSTTPIQVKNSTTPSVTYSLNDRATYDSAQTLKLTPSVTGAAIYYKLQTTPESGTATTTNWMPYKNGISLPAITDEKGDEKTVTYQVTTKAVYCNNQSGETSQTYTITPKHYSVTVKAEGQEDVVTSYNKDETVTVTAPEITGKFFTGWNVDGLELTDAEKKNKVLTFKISKDVTLTATYQNKVDEINITEIETPTPGKEFDTKAKVELKGNNTEVQASKAYTLKWTYLDETITAEDKHVIVRKETADYNTNYEAVLVLKPEEGSLEFADNLTNITVNVGEKKLENPAIQKQTDGSIWVFTGTMTSAKAKLTKVDNISVFAYTGTEASDLPFPTSVIIGTDAGVKIATIKDNKWTCNNYNKESAESYTFTAELDLDSIGVDTTETQNGTITAKVVLQDKPKAAAPTLTSDSAAPNSTYKEAQTVKLATATNGGTIYYQVTQESNSETESNFAAYTEDGITLAVPEKAGASIKYTITAYTKAPSGDDNNNMDNSEKVTFTYTITKPYTVTVNCKDTGLSQETSWTKTVTYSFSKDEIANIVAPEEADEQFDYWEVDENSDLTLSDTEKNSKVISKTLNSDVTLTAVYNPIVKDISVKLNTPVTGEKLASTAAEVKFTVTNEYNLKNLGRTIPITWTPEGNNGTASAYKVYTAKLTMNMDSTEAKFYLSKDLKLSVTDAENEKTVIPSTWAVEKDNDGNDVLAVYATFGKTSKVKAVGVTTPEKVNVKYGTQSDAILEELKKQNISVKLADATYAGATVVWNLDNYDTLKVTAQEVTATGTVTVPEYIDASDLEKENLLTVTAKVYVGGAESVSAPKASVTGGVYTESQNVTLTTDTEGATIYYTTNGEIPTSTSTKYTDETEIQITENTTLRAIAVKKGMQDSSVAGYEYYIHTHVDEDGDGKCDGIKINGETTVECDTVLLGSSEENSTVSVPASVAQSDEKGVVYLRVSEDDISNYNNENYPTTKLKFTPSKDTTTDEDTSTEAEETVSPHNYVFAGWYDSTEVTSTNEDGTTIVTKKMVPYTTMPTVKDSSTGSEVTDSETSTQAENTEESETTEAIKAETDGEIYAKFVDANVLSVKAQITANTTADSEKTNMRFLTSVDGLQYQKLGFEISYTYNNDNKTKTHETSTVYKQIYSAEDGTTVVAEEPQKLFDNKVSQYIIAYRINEIPNDAFNTVFTVKPYWVTMDGTKVYGTSAEKSVSMGLN